MFSGPHSQISASTRYCAVFGHPIRHSASPPMQNAGIDALGLNWRYLAFEVHPDSLASAIDGALSMRFVGLNLTVPHKLLAMELVDELDGTAKEWGAVNTIRFEGRDASGRWRPLIELDRTDTINEWRSAGFNTDADAIIRALKEDLNCAARGQSILLLGAGGAGRVAALRLAAEGAARIHLVNRTEDKAERIAAEMRKRFPETKVFVGYPPDAATRVDIILNATSLGLKETDPLPLNSEAFSIARATAVYDMIYHPAETPLLRLARDAGLRTANGLGMLLYQGAAALEIWTGQTAPVDQMRDALKGAIYA